MQSDPEEFPTQPAGPSHMKWSRKYFFGKSKIEEENEDALGANCHCTNY
jgi:hypothetical protein